MVDVAGWLLGRLLFVLEFGLLALLARVAFNSPGLGAEWFEKAERSLGYLARRRGFAVLTVGVVALVMRVALLPIEPVPSPTVHDEFSYLLAADTFASGRLANPIHPLWMHFETIHEDSFPTYASMYPPAQGLVLALGKRIFGNPFAGVWLSTGLMCAALCWMLQGWVPPGWALLGGLLAVIRLGSFSYWADSYWGGSIAATGGALVLGALPRIQRRPRTSTALLLASGVALLLNSRPYEGFAFSAIAVAILVAWTVQGRVPRGTLVRRIVFPITVVLLSTAVLMGYYNWRVFGSPLTLPYQLNRATYAMAKGFIWQQPAVEPTYHHKVMKDFFVGWEMEQFTRVRTPIGFFNFVGERVATFWRFYIGPVLSVPLFMLFTMMRDRRIRVLLIGAIVFAAVLLPEAWFSPHYAAPVTGLLWVVLVQGMRHLRLWNWHHKRLGLALVRLIPIVCMLMFAIRIGMAGMPQAPWLHWPLSWATVWTVPLHRDEIIAQLHKYGGPHLVMVRYSEKHHPFQEYVFNEADIDRSRIVWAREMGPAQDRELTTYFKGRRVWLLEPDGDAYKLSPYPVER